MQSQLDSEPSRVGLVSLYSAHAFTLLLGPGLHVPHLESMQAFVSGTNMVYSAAPRPVVHNRIWGVLPVHIRRHWVRIVNCA